MCNQTFYRKTHSRLPILSAYAYCFSNKRKNVLYILYLFLVQLVRKCVNNNLLFFPLFLLLFPAQLCLKSWFNFQPWQLKCLKSHLKTFLFDTASTSLISWLFSSFSRSASGSDILVSWIMALRKQIKMLYCIVFTHPVLALDLFHSILFSSQTFNRCYST